MADVNAFVASVRNLPALSQAVVRLLSLLQGGQATPDEIEQVAASDQALSLSILRVANSALYGRAGRTFTLREAITRLGRSTLARIVLQQRTADLFAEAGAAYELQRGELWLGALGGAIAAEKLARELELESPDLCFLCSLLRDVGKLVFDVQHGRAYTALVAAHLGPDVPFDAAERATFGFDHAEVGAALARVWGLPERMAQAIAVHHRPPERAPEHDVLFDVVHASDLICLWAGLGVGSDGLQYRLSEHVRTGLDITRARSERLIAETWLAVRETADAMSAPAARTSA